MSEENRENRIDVDDLPQAEQELTSEESKEVQGGGEINGNLQIADLTSVAIDPVTGARISKIVIDK